MFSQFSQSNYIYQLQWARSPLTFPEVRNIFSKSPATSAEDLPRSQEHVITCFDSGFFRREAGSMARARLVLVPVLTVAAANRGRAGSMASS